MNPQFAEQVRKYVVDTFMFGQSNGICDEDSFLDRGIFDSTAVLELVSWIEDQYGIRVDEGELVPENFDSIKSVAAYVDGKLNEAAGRLAQAGVIRDKQQDS
jgi:acyl carrier protein